MIERVVRAAPETARRRRRAGRVALPKAGGCALVIFGATGDLTRRKLMPALWRLQRQRCFDECFSILGVGRDELGDEGFQRRDAGGAPGVLRRAPVRRGVGRLRRQALVSRRRPDRGRCLPPALGPAERLGRERVVAREPPLLSRRSALARAADRERSRIRRPDRRGARLDADRRREAVRPRSRVRARSERGDPRGVRRATGVSDRPLPREGNRSEHPRITIRQHAVRAPLESELHRVRGDHGGRDPGRGGPGRFLRRDGSPARHDRQPPAAAPDADRDGAAGGLRFGVGAGGEGPGSSLDRPAVRRGRRAAGRPRPARARRGGGRAGRGVPRDRGRRSRSRRPRPTWPWS